MPIKTGTQGFSKYTLLQGCEVKIASAQQFYLERYVSSLLPEFSDGNPLKPEFGLSGIS
jgi:hypothetical protein